MSLYVDLFHLHHSCNSKLPRSKQEQNVFKAVQPRFEKKIFYWEENAECWPRTSLFVNKDENILRHEVRGGKRSKMYFFISM